MRKLFFVLFIIFIGLGVLAEDSSSSSLWDIDGQIETGNLERATDQDFQEALESKKGKPKKNKNIPKGENIQQSSESDILQNVSAQINVLLVPTSLQANNGTVIPVGHYLVSAEKKDDDNIMLTFYQAHKLIAQINATETLDDFNHRELFFVELQPYDDEHARIIFGCIQFNAFAMLKIVP